MFVLSIRRNRILGKKSIISWLEWYVDILDESVVYLLLLSKLYVEVCKRDIYIQKQKISSLKRYKIPRRVV